MILPPALVGIELKNSSDYKVHISRMTENGFSYKEVNKDSTLFELLI